MIDIPVLFFPFVRPEYAKQTFDAIKKAQPKRFYFYCDKAREGNQEEINNNNIIRNYINDVDWDCNLKTWFRDENIGVYSSIMNAIDWFFENEEMGIILEEDCLPSLAFFDFCRQLLPKYENDQRVWFISGNNFIRGYNPNAYDYIFSTVIYQWGWATWRDRWYSINRNGFSVSEIIKYKLNRQFYSSSSIAKFSNKQLLRVQNNDGIWKPKSWDYIFQMSMRCNGGFGIIPIHNLVSNIGVLGVNSSTDNKKIHNLKTPKETVYKIEKHPPFIVPDIQYANMFFRKIIKSRRNIFTRLGRFLKL